MKRSKLVNMLQLVSYAISHYVHMHKAVVFYSHYTPNTCNKLPTLLFNIYKFVF